MGDKNDEIQKGKAMAMTTGGALASIVPQSLDDVVRLARMAVMGGILKPIHWKKRVKNDDGRWVDDEGEEDFDTVLARGSMIIMQGLEVGVPPMQALQLMAMINGRITAHSELVPGILWAHGFQIEQLMTGTPYADDWTAQCKLTRPGGTTITRMFSVADAKKAGLWSPNARIKRKGRNSDYEVDNDSPWHRYPQRMLMARALGFAAKDGGSDAMRGMMVSEESEDIVRMREARDVTPITTSESSTAPVVDDGPPDPDAPAATKASAVAAPVVDDGPPDPDATEDEIDPSPPSNVAQWLDALSDDVAAAGGDKEAIAEIRMANAPTIRALTMAAMIKAKAILGMAPDEKL